MTINRYIYSHHFVHSADKLIYGKIMAIQHYNIRVLGKVQAVWFRVSTKEEADRLGISGFARNEADGAVYIEAEGGEEVLEEFVKWCHIGSEQSEVDEVTVKKGDVHDFTSFHIIG